MQCVCKCFPREFQKRKGGVPTLWKRAFLFFANFFIAHTQMQSPRRKKVIIDTDGGLDDILAILLAVSSPELEVLAITTVSGNVDVEQATQNIRLFLHLLAKWRPALFSRGFPIIAKGASQPLVYPLYTATYYRTPNSQ